MAVSVFVGDPGLDRSVSVKLLLERGVLLAKVTFTGEVVHRDRYRVKLLTPPVVTEIRAWGVITLRVGRADVGLVMRIR